MAGYLGIESPALAVKPHLEVAEQEHLSHGLMLIYRRCLSGDLCAEFRD